MPDPVPDSGANPVMNPASWGMDRRLRNVAQFGAVGVLVCILAWMMFKDDKDAQRRYEAESRMAEIQQRHSDRLVDILKEGQAREAANADKIAKSQSAVAKAIGELRAALVNKAPPPQEVDHGMWGTIKREFERLKAGAG